MSTSPVLSSSACDRDDSNHDNIDDEDDDDANCVFEPLQIPCEINGFTIPAIIDTGAQITVMSAACAKRCRVSNLVDDRFAGKAVGIGSSDILGRIDELAMRVGPLSYHNQVAVLRESRVDLIIGLDFLRRFKAEINLDQRLLKLRVREKTIRMPFITSENSQLKTFKDAAKDRDGEVDETYDGRPSWGPRGGAAAPHAAAGVAGRGGATHDAAREHLRDLRDGRERDALRAAHDRDRERDRERDAAARERHGERDSRALASDYLSRTRPGAASSPLSAASASSSGGGGGMMTDYGDEGSDDDLDTGDRVSMEGI